MIKNTFILITFIISITAFTTTSKAQMFDEEVFKFAKTLSQIENYYVDTVNKSDLVETAIIKMLEKLDPHSIYISKEELKKMNEPLQGSFDGVGIQFNILRDTLTIVATITGGPSEKVGLLAGDQIVKVDEEEIAGVGIKNSDVFRLLRGDRGTKVDLLIKRQSVKKPTTYTVTRGKIPINSLDAAYLVDNSTIYIKLNRFSATSMKEYRESLEKLKTKNTTNIILDLTNNGGGYLKTAIDLADEFLNEKEMIVYTEGTHAPRESYKATNTGDFKKGKVVIMIDEGSASASEIVSGAIQDWDRGIIVGRRSFGKGLVQKPFGLPDGSAMRLTIARYHTPTGRVIQKPYDKGVKNYHRDLLKRYEHGELMHKDSISFPDSLIYKTRVNGRNVYGGGGIMPDVFVPIDTTNYSNFYRQLIRKGILNEFVLTEVNKNRDELLKKYPTFEYFKKEYKVSDDFYNQLLTMAETKKLTPKNDDLERSGSSIKAQLKALVARNLYGIHEFFELINPLDPIFLKALEVIQNDKRYNEIITKQ